MSYVPSLITAVLLILALRGMDWLLIRRHRAMGSERKFPRQMVMLGLTLFAVVAIIMTLPVDESSRNRLIGLVGLVISGTIAFSSTNILANLMGGILLRITKPFSMGDFVRVGDHFGRVSDRGLFDTEIQTESRELISLPNAYLMNHPITTTHSTGAIVSITLSLGYDVHHGVVEPLLTKAAEESGLAEPFVHVLELGNYAVTYRISGVLEETKRLITAHSNLRRLVLDTLHGAGVEIMSPSFMNQRRLADGNSTVPGALPSKKPVEPEGGEHLAFDKADEAQQREEEKARLLKDIEQFEAALKTEDDAAKEKIRIQLESARARISEMEQAGQVPDGPEPT